MKTMTIEQQAKCHAIIHSASASAGAVGAGLAQIPCSDNVIITPIQLTMTIALGRVFELELTESAAKASIATMATAAVGRPLSQLLVGWMPLIGNIVNAATAAGITETLGWMLANDFAQQAT